MRPIRMPVSRYGDDSPSARSRDAPGALGHGRIYGPRCSFKHACFMYPGLLFAVPIAFRTCTKVLAAGGGCFSSSSTRW